MINVKVEGADRVALKMSRAARAVKDLQKPFKQIGDLLIQEYGANFPARGSVLKKSWAPRKDSYPWPLLMKTGALQRGFEKKVKKRSLSVQNTVAYAKYHHFGMAPQAGRRELVGVTKKLADAAKMRIIAHVKKALAR